MCRIKTGERAQLWFTVLVFTQSDGVCFISSIIDHQVKEYYPHFHRNTPLEWIVHHTPSGYMDRYGWLKSMAHLSTVCGTSPFDNYILLFDGHDSHFDDHTLCYISTCNIQPFVLKSGKYGNDQPKDNGPNSKLK